MDRTGFRILIYLLFLLVTPVAVNADNSNSVNTGAATSESRSTDSDKDNKQRKDTEISQESESSDSGSKADSGTAKTQNSAEDSDKNLSTDKKKNTTVLKVVVIQIGEGKVPIKDARVIITYGDATEFERKTDASGMAMLTGLPYGKVDVDVTSSGRQSDGGSLLLDAPSKTLTFYLKPRTAVDQE